MDSEERQKLQYEKMTGRPVKNLLIELSIPTIITMMVTNIYNIVDAGFVGTLGNSQSGATGVVFGFMTILQAFGFLCGQGAGSIMSRRLGEKNMEEATKYTTTGFMLSFAFGLLLEILGFIFMEPMLKILGSTKTIAPYAKTYLVYILLSGPFFTSSFTMNNLLRYEGKAKLGTIGMMTGAVLNICLDAILIFGFKLGIAGAGIATAIAQTVSFGILISMFLRNKTQTKVGFKYLAKDLGTYMNVITTGFPSLLRQGLNSVATMILNQKAGFYGDAAVAAMSVVSRISFFPMSVAVGIGQGFQPISSFNYGAGKNERVREAFFKALIGSEIALTIFCIPIFAFSPQLVQVMRNDANVIEIGTRALRLMSVANIFLPLTMMVEMGFQSTGAKLLASIGSSLRSGVIFIPTLIIMANIRGLSGIEEAQPLSFVLTFCVSIYLCSVFLKRLKRKAG